jgi:RHS repeat-associated protein
VDDRTGEDDDVTSVYDGADRLISRTEPGAGPDRAETILYFYWGGGASLAEEADGAGNTLVRYACDTSGNALAQQSYRVVNGHADPTDTEGTWRWLLVDADANVATQLNDDGTVAEQSAFNPYGKPQAGGSSVTDPKQRGSTLGFQGAITDRVSGSAVLGPRLYDPSTARFSTADSFVSGGLDLGLALDPLTGNRYLFAGANPVAYFDDGHHPLYKDKKEDIEAAATESSVDATLLAAVIQHEGDGRSHLIALLGRRRFQLLESRIGDTVGIAQLAASTANMRLAAGAGLGEFKSLAVFRSRLIRDDRFSFRLAAAYLQTLQVRQGFAGRRAFIAYAYSSRGIDFLSRYNFCPRAASVDAFLCGRRCSDASLFDSLIGRYYEYNHIIGGIRGEIDAPLSRVPGR